MEKKNQSIATKMHHTIDAHISMHLHQCVVFCFFLCISSRWVEKSRDTKNCETNVEQQISGGRRANENKWYIKIRISIHLQKKTNRPLTFKANKNIHKRSVVECVCVHGILVYIYLVTRRQNSNTFLNCIFLLGFSMHCHCGALVSVSSFHICVYSSLFRLQVKFFTSSFFPNLGSKAFLWPIVWCVIFRRRRRCCLVVCICFAFANLFVVYIHTWWGHHRQTHIEMHAIIHTDWKNENCNSKCTQPKKKIKH